MQALGSVCLNGCGGEEMIARYTVKKKVSFTPEQKRRLDVLCKERNVEGTTLIREAVLDYIAKAEAEKSKKK